MYVLMGKKLKGVAPFAGAWIEIWYEYEKDNPKVVAPFAGAWIEILMEMKFRE